MNINYAKIQKKKLNGLTLTELYVRNRNTCIFFKLHILRSHNRGRRP